MKALLTLLLFCTIKAVYGQPYFVYDQKHLASQAAGQVVNAGVERIIDRAHEKLERDQREIAVSVAMQGSTVTLNLRAYENVGEALRAPQTLQTISALVQRVYNDQVAIVELLTELNDPALNMISGVIQAKLYFFGVVELNKIRQVLQPQQQGGEERKFFATTAQRRALVDQFLKSLMLLSGEVSAVRMNIEALAKSPYRHQRRRTLMSESYMLLPDYYRNLNTTQFLVNETSLIWGN